MRLWSRRVRAIWVSWPWKPPKNWRFVAASGAGTRNLVLRFEVTKNDTNVFVEKPAALKAALLHQPKSALQIADVARPVPGNGQSAARARLRRLPDRSAHPGRRTSIAPLAADSRSSDRRRCCRERDARSADRSASGSVVDGRRRRHLSVLPPRSRKSVRLANVHGLFGRWRLCGIRGRARRFRFSLTASA